MNAGIQIPIEKRLIIKNDFIEIYLKNKLRKVLKKLRFLGSSNSLPV